MFTQKPEKVDNNPLRKLLQERGYSLRSAARALGMHPTTMCYRLEAYNERDAFAERVRALPPKPRKDTTL